MKLTTIFGIIMLALADVAPTVSTYTESPSKNERDLVFVASFKNYNDWYSKAFRPDTQRRSRYCQENLTTVGKIDDNTAIIYLNDFDMARMQEFASDASMNTLMPRLPKYIVITDFLQPTNKSRRI
ncbi:hypothetical protein [Flagellimonas marinaquae]